MNIPPASEVCIIGGGPAGLSAAIALRQAGYGATLVERAVPPIDKACGEGLMPDSLAVLGRLGIEIPGELGFRFRGIRFSDSQSSVVADFPAGLGIGLRRTALHDLLLRRCHEIGVKFLWGEKDVQLIDNQVHVGGKILKASFIVAADGQHSQVRKQSGLGRLARERRRYGFRRHYRIAPWSPYMELHWGPTCQIYVTPVADDEVCVVSMSRQSSLRLDRALHEFPRLQARLEKADFASRETGALSVSRKLRRVTRPWLALVGDASGSADAITGEGLCLSFQQALALAEALKAGDLSTYQRKHAVLSRRPQLMGSLMLTLDKHMGFQRKALASLARHPEIFASLLGIHVGEGSFLDLFSWQLVYLCGAFLKV